MKQSEFQEQMQDTINELFHDLDQFVASDRGCPTVECCIVDFILRFYVDRIEWERNTTDTAQKSLIKIRMCDMLHTHKEHIEELIARCKQ